MVERKRCWQRFSGGRRSNNGVLFVGWLGIRMAYLPPAMPAGFWGIEYHCAVYLNLYKSITLYYGLLMIALAPGLVNLRLARPGRSRLAMAALTGGLK